MFIQIIMIKGNEHFCIMERISKEILVETKTTCGNRGSLGYRTIVYANEFLLPERSPSNPVYVGNAVRSKAEARDEHSRVVRDVETNPKKYYRG